MAASMFQAYQPTLHLDYSRLAVKLPTIANQVKNFDPNVIQADASSVRVILHANFPSLVQDVLAHKRTHGSAHEKALYTPSFTWRDEVTRLVAKRPLMFMGESDTTLLRNGTTLWNGVKEWDRNGTPGQDQNEYLTLDEYLSYDEIMLSSLLGVSGQSYFINDGARNNRGKRGAPGTFQERGVIVGLVGARFEREDRMDSVYVLPSEGKHQHPDLLALFETFFGVTKNVAVAGQGAFDANMYMARMRITIDMLLLEANDRAQETGQTAYTYVVGLGLGVWQYSHTQPTLYIDTFTAALSELSLPNVSTLEFAWIDVDAACIARVTAAAKKQVIKVLFSKRNPAERLDTDELLVISYAWDGNAFPGNEYWAGMLAASGDPAAVCMSTIAELHNPLVNDFTGRINVLRG
ncbi:hypothetical protein ACET3X_006342 [Alternaria dauci]|uniref:Uncharacterized protein n=1 Tax=Alternaria dauci TaxID=48095 RepID=A0ABR3UI13_9PLEO